jgi:predicted AAA+ superfamily ATPase
MDDDALNRIANALERMGPATPIAADPDAKAYVWQGGVLNAVPHFAPLALDLLTGIDTHRDAVLTNTARLAAGHAAHDVLLWGARGSGKSALVKAVVGALQDKGSPIALIEVAGDALTTLPALFAVIRDWPRACVVFLDDIGFDESGSQARALRSVLEGGASARPAHVRIYATSNRRHIVPRDMAAQESAINPRDVADDQLALADRFGLSLGFHVCDQETYLAMVAGYARHLGVSFAREDALLWAAQRGSRSGRVAWHYAVELAGRAGQSI